MEKALDREKIRHLKGTEEDLETQEYKRLKEQLGLIRKANERYRFIYLMGKRPDGKVFFYVDSEPPDSKDYSPPGQIYDEADEAEEGVFQGKAWVGGPFEDRWGVWMSALVPVKEAEGNVIALLGIDIAAKDWRWLVFKNSIVSLFPVTMAFVIAMAGLFSAYSFFQKNRALSLLLESEGKVKRILDNAHDLIYRIELYPEPKVSFANQAFLRILGSGLATVDPNLILNSLIPEHRDTFLELLKGRLKVEDSVFLTFMGPNGEPIHTEHRMIPIKDKAGALVAIEGIGRDITSRIRAEEALKESQEFLKLVLDTIPVRVFWKDNNLKYLGCNRSFIKDTGFEDPEEIIGKDDFQMPWKAEAEAFRRDDMEVLNTQRPKLGYEESRKTPDGKIFWGRTSKVPLKNQKGEIIGVLGTYEDITEYKHFLQDQERAQRIEALGNLAAGIAHDFNNLLQGILGFVEMAKLRSEDLKIREYLMKASSAIEQAKGLTHQLLTFSKGGEPNLERLPLYPFVLDQVKLALGGRQVDLTLEQPEEELWADYDRTQLAQVIHNIVNNAVEAMREGGRLRVYASSLEIEGHHRLSEGKYVRISIEDSGPGISQEILERIFDPFFTTKEMGHGLGLAISDSIIKRHGGEIEVETQLGKGSTFHIYLPAKGPLLETQKKRETVQKIAQGPRRPYRILILDDEDMLREFLVEALQDMGYEVEEAKDGQTALQIFERAKSTGKKFDAMLLDLTVFGGLGGKDIIGKIRQIDKDIPAIVSSGYHDDPVIVNPQLYGFSDSITKPYRLEDLEATLKRYLLVNKI